MTQVKQWDLMAVGELLVDMTPQVVNGQIFFQPHPGGAPCNFLAMAQHMGARTAFVGKVGKDQFGEQLRSAIEKVGVNTDGLIMSSETPTTLAFVHLAEDGERQFSFYRKGCADVSLQLQEVDLDRLEACKAFYFGSLAFTDEPLKSVVLTMLKQASENNMLICYDPNYRPLLWKSEEAAVEAMLEGLVYADILKVSEEEAILLTGESQVRKAALLLAKQDIQLVCVTLGDRGTLAVYQGKCQHIPAISVQAVDTTGAGDAFFGTLMALILEQDESLESIGWDALAYLIERANIAAGICVQQFGAIPALPTREQVLQYKG